MALGAHWFSHTRPAPQDWNATGQLMRANLLPVTLGLSGQVTTVHSVMRPELHRNFSIVASSPAAEFFGHPERSQIRTAA